MTLAFAAVMAIVLTAVGLFLHLRLEAQLNHSIDQGLRSRATEVSAFAPEAGGGLSGSGGGNPLIEQDEGFAQILTVGGQVVDSSPQLRDNPALAGGDLTLAAREPLFLQVGDLPGVEGPLRLLAVPVDTHGGRIVVVGASLGDRNEALAGLTKLLLIGGPVALLLASLAGYGMAAAALRPVDSMRRRAAEISAAQAGARLPVPGARDELSRLGETLNAMLDRLEAAIERERRFVDDASHELRTPLALHKVELELALRHATDEAQLRTAIASATDEIDRLIALAEDLLVVARSEDGEPRIERRPVAVDDLFGSLATRFAARAERAGRELRIEPPGEKTVIDADRSRLEQTLTNLLENALRHGEGPIRVWTCQGAGAIELHVSDEGEGFPDEFVAHAFERFSRADGARTEAGTGLGLAIVESIARAHGGNAGTRNRPGGGADVWVSLPLPSPAIVRDA